MTDKQLDRLWKWVIRFLGLFILLHETLWVQSDRTSHIAAGLGLILFPHVVDLQRRAKNGNGS